MEELFDVVANPAQSIPDAAAIHSSIVANPVALNFCLVILAVFCVGVLLLVIRLLGGRLGARLISVAPSTLATLGVLGTFTGILLGLLDFNVDKIDASIPKLLGGLTVAFSTSIVGMGLALFFRVLDAIVPKRAATGAATAEDLLDELKKIHESGWKQNSSIVDALSDKGAVVSGLTANRALSEKQSEEMATGLAGIRKALSSDSDSSLVTQIQKLRATIQDGQGDLISEFRDFSKHMTENTNKVLIEALEGVIRDFNNKITEQFGDNFKELNAAVGALLEWQENYKAVIEKTEQRITSTVGALEASEKALGAVKEHSAAIPTAIALLAPPLTTLNEQSKTLASHLDAVGGIREKAMDAFPMIEGNLNKLTAEFGKHVENVVSKTGVSLELQQAANEDLSKRSAMLAEESTKTQKTFASEFEGALEKMRQETGEAFNQHTKLIESSTDRCAELEKEFSMELRRVLGKMTEETEAAFVHHTKLVEQASSRVTAMSEESEKVQKAFSVELERALEKMTDETSAAFSQHTQLIEKSTSEMQRQISDAWKRTEESINGRMETLDDEIQKELQRTLSIMGSNLASVSEKFVSDYTPLTERLREVVQIAARAS